MKIQERNCFSINLTIVVITAFMMLFFIIERKMIHVLFSPNPIKGKESPLYRANYNKDSDPHSYIVINYTRNLDG